MNESPLSEKQLQALLRLKRHEQPPPGYFDQLLTDIHRRQREELLRRPAWRLFLDRVRAYFATLDWRYAGSMAGILLIGIAVIQIALPGPKAQETVATVPASPNMKMVKAPRNPKPEGPGTEAAPVRFPIEPMPASYEPTRIRF